MTGENAEIVEQLNGIEDTVNKTNMKPEPEYTPEYTEVELKAMEKGWNPDKESVPEGKEWIQAGEFLRNESFFTEIRKLKRDLNSTKKSFDVLKEHHKKVAEVAKEEALVELKRQKKVALEEDDHAAVVDIDDKIQDIKSEKADPVDIQEGDNVIYEAWVDKNSWYETNEKLRRLADTLGTGYVAQNNVNGVIDPNKVYEYVEREIKQMHPEEFGGKKSTKTTKPTVEGATASRGGKTGSKSKFTKRDLSDEQRSVMNRFVKTGALTEEAYINELVKIGELS